MPRTEKGEEKKRGKCPLIHASSHGEGERGKKKLKGKKGEGASSLHQKLKEKGKKRGENGRPFPRCSTRGRSGERKKKKKKEGGKGKNRSALLHFCDSAYNERG